MGSAGSDAAKSVVGESTYKAVKKGWDQYGVYVGNGGTTLLTNAYNGYRRDGYNGAQAGAVGTANQAVDGAVATVKLETPTPEGMVDPDMGAEAAPEILEEADPAKRRRRLVEGRAGTILTANGTSPGGSNLGGTGARSTLLGL